jgi:multiple sugar transport system ATP-binding protein
MRADISKLQRDLGTTTIYVTHDQVEAMTMGDRVAVMNAGVLLQADAPQRLYDEPANLFVAGFIGTPPMNLLGADVHVENGSVALAVGEQRIELSDAVLNRYPGVRGAAGRRAVLGIRSDDLHLARNRPELPTFTATLQLVESLGSQSMAYFKVDAESLRTDADDEAELQPEVDAEGVTATRPNLVAAFAARDALSLKLDDRVPLAVDVAQVHVFDADSGAPLR